MKTLRAYRHSLIKICLLAGFAAVAFGLGAGTEAADGINIGLLALSLPRIETVQTCAICIRTREAASDYAPVEHFMGGPKRIILMRHADKTDDSEDEDLSDAGEARAQRLATYIPETFGKPDIIIATAHSKHSDRPKETVQPLADAVGLRIEHDYEDKDFPDLVEDIFNDPDYKNKTVVICWHHGNLPAMAAMLGAPTGSYPDPWPADAYNIILDLQYDPFSSSPPKVSRVIEPF
ncbi:MAG: histidine phosphatase family protein [Hyphomicrobium sp.]|uniref:histidine phosphatase family protein n=1 Tax=Hyphomicrobium sp. TaxID=82 RepID=UPI0039E4D46C